MKKAKITKRKHLCNLLSHLIIHFGIRVSPKNVLIDQLLNQVTKCIISQSVSQYQKNLNDIGFNFITTINNDTKIKPHSNYYFMVIFSVFFNTYSTQSVNILFTFNHITQFKQFSLLLKRCRLL